MRRVYLRAIQVNIIQNISKGILMGAKNEIFLMLGKSFVFQSFESNAFGYVVLPTFIFGVRRLKRESKQNTFILLPPCLFSAFKPTFVFYGEHRGDIFGRQLSSKVSKHATMKIIVNIRFRTDKQNYICDIEKFSR